MSAKTARSKNIHLRLDVIENKLKTLPLKGKVTDCFCTENGDVLVAASGQAFGLVTRHSTTRPTKPRVSESAFESHAFTFHSDASWRDKPGGRG